MKVLASNLDKSPTIKMRQNKPAFKGGKIKASQQLMDEIYKNSAKFPRFLMKIGQNDGEILNTIVTAVGTAAVAPIFIAFNPFSKEDKDTKIYSALRQPISAVIALAMQISVNKGFNNYMNKKASTGGFDRADLRAKPKASYLKRIIKLEHPEYTKNQISAEVAARQISAEKRVIAQKRAELKGKEIGYEELISKDSYDVAKNELTAELKETNKEYLSKMTSKQSKKFFEENISDASIRARAAKNIQREVSMETATKVFVRNMAKQCSTVDEAMEIVAKRQEELKVAKKPNKVGQQFSQIVMDRLETIKSYEESKGMKPFSSVTDLGATPTEIKQNVKIKKMVRAHVSDAEKILGKYTKLLGILVSLATLPISCGLLNWAYPRIMEKIMPQTAAKKNGTVPQPQKTGGEK